MWHRQRRMMYHPVGLLYAPRTCAEFAQMHYRGGHQARRTSLIDLGVDCVTQFSLDYMHMHGVFGCSETHLNLHDQSSSPISVQATSYRHHAHIREPMHV